MNDGPKLSEKFYEPYLYQQNDHTRSSRFNLPQVEMNCTIFQSIICLMLLWLNFVCPSISDYALKINWKKIALELVN